MLAPHHRIVAFMSDRNNGLINGVAKVFPESPHYFCHEHLIRSLNSAISKSSNRQMKKMSLLSSSKCAYSRIVPGFNHHMTKLLAEASDDIKTFLACLPQRHWSCAYTQGNRYGDVGQSVV